MGKSEAPSEGRDPPPLLTLLQWGHTPKCRDAPPVRPELDRLRGWQSTHHQVRSGHETGHRVHRASLNGPRGRPAHTPTIVDGSVGVRPPEGEAVVRLSIAARTRAPGTNVRKTHLRRARPRDPSARPSPVAQLPRPHRPGHARSPLPACRVVIDASSVASVVEVGIRAAWKRTQRRSTSGVPRRSWTTAKRARAAAGRPRRSLYQRSPFSPATSYWYPTSTRIRTVAAPPRPVPHHAPS